MGGEMIYHAREKKKDNPKVIYTLGIPHDNTS
jgi:hypothetical protein